MFLANAVCEAVADPEFVKKREGRESKFRHAAPGLKKSLGGGGGDSDKKKSL